MPESNYHGRRSGGGSPPESDARAPSHNDPASAIPAAPGSGAAPDSPGRIHHEAQPFVEHPHSKTDPTTTTQPTSDNEDTGVPHTGGRPRNSDPA